MTAAGRAYRELTGKTKPLLATAPYYPQCLSCGRPCFEKFARFCSQTCRIDRKRLQKRAYNHGFRIGRPELPPRNVRLAGAKLKMKLRGYRQRPPQCSKERAEHRQSRFAQRRAIYYAMRDLGLIKAESKHDAH